MKSFMTMASVLAALVDNRHVRPAFPYLPAPKKGPKHVGDGAKRAAKRHAEKLEANKAILSNERHTRQQRRLEYRQLMKSVRISEAEFGRRKMDAINKGRAA